MPPHLKTKSYSHIKESKKSRPNGKKAYTSVYKFKKKNTPQTKFTYRQYPGELEKLISDSVNCFTPLFLHWSPIPAIVGTRMIWRSTKTKSIRT